MTRVLGVVGGGQLGRYFIESTRRLGFTTVVLDPDPNCPASLVVDRHHIAAYDDHDAVRTFAESCDAVTIEFENVPVSCLEVIASSTELRPNPTTVEVAADRIREKDLIRDLGGVVAPFATLVREDDVVRVAEWAREGGSLTGDVILKSARLGYDGKGQKRLHDIGSRTGMDLLREAWVALGRTPCVVESLVPLDREFSIIIARATNGKVVSFDATVNQHVSGILDASVVDPGEPLSDDATRFATQLAHHLHYVGVLAVEFFVSAGRLLVNEIAPRPHNSGHWTMDGATMSQFDLQTCAVADLAFGEVATTHDGVAMVNLLGDLWEHGEPDWRSISGFDDVHIHLYGKREARPGRKMGHLTVVGGDAGAALVRAREIRSRLVDP